MSSKHKQAMGVVAALVKAAKPGAGIAVAAGVGAAAAQVGGALLKHQFPQANAFAAKGHAQEGLVDLAGGVVLDVPLVIGAGVMWGKRGAAQVAPVLLAGTVISAFAPLAAPYVEHLVASATNLIGGHAALPAPGGYGDHVIDMVPGGVSLGSKDLF